jgi:hypothetical protein
MHPVYLGYNSFEAEYALRQKIEELRRTPATLPAAAGGPRIAGGPIEQALTADHVEPAAA